MTPASTVNSGSRLPFAFNPYSHGNEIARSGDGGKKKFVCAYLALAILLAALPPAAFAAGEIAAKVNNTAITTKEVNAEMERLLPLETYHGALTEANKSALREKALENLIEAELFYQDGVAHGVKADKKRIKEEYQKTREKFKTSKEFREALDAAGLTEDGLRTLIEKGSLIRAAIEKTVIEPSRTSDAQLREHYNRNLEKFRKPEGFRLRVVSAKDEEKVAEALERVKKGDDFGIVAEEMSEDKYRVMGGDIGFMHKGQTNPLLEETAFKLKVGEVSGILHSEGDWFIIKLEAKTPEQQLSFDEVKEKLRKELEGKNIAENRKKWVADLRAKAKIVVLLGEQAKE